MATALAYSPYLDTLGGGEAYFFRVALCLRNHGYQVTLAWPNTNFIKPAKELLNLDLSNLNLDKQAYKLLSTQSSFLEKLVYLKKYHLIFTVSDGSIPFVGLSRHLLHFQVPFPQLQSTWVNNIKLAHTQIICNSKFTKSVVDQRLHTNSKVLYPPLVSSAKPNSKKPIILSVGRFTDTLHNKRQDILISAFKTMVDQGLTGWRLQLLGNITQHQAKQLVDKLKTQAKGYPINFLVNAPFHQLETCYSQASIYWHAAGYQVDQHLYPDRVEHFGLVTVEAMQAGCVPVVINKGGQPEIVQHNRSGFVFDSISELIDITQNLISHPKLLASVSKKAQIRAQKFSDNHFCTNLAKML